MRAGQLLGALAVVGGVPVAALLTLAATGAVAAGPALVSLTIVLLGALVVSLVWMSDMERLTKALKLAAAEQSVALAQAAGAPWLPPVERATRAVEQMSRALATRAAQVRQLLRATETIVDRLPDPLLVLGADRTVKRANAAARAAFGGDIAAVLRHPDLRAAIDRAFALSASTGRVSQMVELTIPAPVPRELQATVLVMDPPLADGGSAIVVLSDRTRERLVERMRADFVANASHELRTPLASLIGFIETLRGPAVDDQPAQQRFLGIMAEQAERMNRLIDDLLSLSRIELTEHQSPGETVAVADVVLRIAAAFEPRVAARRARLELDLGSDLPAVAGDADQLEQVVQNLIDNAVKYGVEGGTVRLCLRLATPGRWPSRRGVLLTVTDDGPGIPKAHVPRLTERFYRVDKGRSRSAGGTGLGLAIVKHIVNRHRGLLAIDSEEGRGSTFSVWLPVVTDRESST